MIYKKGRYYMAKFMWQGRMIRKSTRCTSGKDARAVEGKLRSELAKGNFGILDAKPRLTVAEFLKRDFLPFIETEFQTKPNSRDYYSYGVRNLQASDLAGLRLDHLTSQHVTGYIAQHGHLEASTINRDLRTLRRALSLAVEWGKLDRMPKVALAKGENRRERVLTEDEAEKYLAACPQPWKDVATVMLGTGACPGELYELQWENVLLNGKGGLLHIVKGKTKARRRLLPMVPRVYQALKTRHEGQAYPTEGWVFPTGSASGHMEESSAKQWHEKALKISGVTPFPPYSLRHTALTKLGAAGCDVFTLARIAGHSTIAITQRYVHPQSEAVELAFRKLVTEGGHLANSPAEAKADTSEINLDETKG